MKRKSTKTTKPRRAGARHIPRSQHAHVHFSVAAIMIGVWVLLGILTGLFLVYANQQQTASRAAAKPGDISVVVDQVSYDPTGVSLFTPGTGMHFVIVGLQITNYTAYTFNFAPVLQTYLTDEHDAKYTMSPDPVDNPIAAGPIPSQATLTGQLTYDVPISSHKLVFHFVTLTSPLVDNSIPIQ